MHLLEWKVKGESAAVFIMNYHLKGLIYVRIAGCLSSGRQQYPRPSKN